MTAPREFYAQTDLVDKIIQRSDLGEAYELFVTVYPHRESLKHQTKFIEASQVIPAERMAELTARIEKLEKALEKCKEQRNSMAFRALKTVDFNTSWLEMNKEIDEMLR